MESKARANVEASFRAPIGTGIEPGAAREVSCPYCRSINTEFSSLFGQQLLTEQYYCNDCHTPFEYVKDG